jgi:hypothetical protein
MYGLGTRALALPKDTPAQNRTPAPAAHRSRSRCPSGRCGARGCWAGKMCAPTALAHECPLAPALAGRARAGVRHCAGSKQARCN